MCRLVWLLGALFLLMGCGGAQVAVVPTVTMVAPTAIAPVAATVTPTQPPPATATPLPTAVPTAIPHAPWVYALVVPFPTLLDGVSLETVEAAWRGEVTELGRLVLDEATAVELAPLLGTAAISQTYSADELVAQLWAEPPAWSVVPFERLEPRLKVLRVAGAAPIDRDFDPAAYALIAEKVGVTESNYARDEMTFLALSGPSGLGRAVAHRIELYGYDHPAEHIRPLFDSVDFAHFSNEMPFAEDCPASELEMSGDTRFCVPTRYIEVMRALGANINEMTGNHVNDWGQAALQHTFDLYEQEGIMTYGGGRDLAAAREPLLLEHNGNRIALVGCNSWGPPYAWAADGYAGANPCGDFSQLEAQIGELAAEGWQVVVTLQYFEYYYYEPRGEQAEDYGRLARAGATAVSGSSSHHAQGFAFEPSNGTFIHYGLGNLVFDQMDYLGTRQSFVDVYVFAHGRLLNVDLWTGLIEDFCCVRPMASEERAELLATTFGASGWEER